MRLLPMSPLLASSSTLPSLGIRVGTDATMLQDYSAAAAGLFGNMRIPAALVAGAVIPLGFVAAPQLEKGKEGTIQRLVKIVHALCGIFTLTTELVTIVWSTISVNKLTEVAYLPTENVMALLQRDFELQWLACNVHFLGGLFALAAMTGMRMFMLYGRRVGSIAMLSAASSICLMTGVVNDGISLGDGVNGGVSFGSTNLLSLVRRYVVLLVLHAAKGPRPLLCCAFACALAAIALSAKELRDQFSSIQERKQDEAGRGR